MPRLQTILLALLAAVGTNCVTIFDFPQCAQTCITRSAAAIGGDKTDPNFVCKSTTFLSSAESCQTQTCSPSDLAQIFTLGLQLCVPVGGVADNGLFNLSACAQPGLTTAKAQSGCSDTDWPCICSNPAFTVGAARYEDRYCSFADRQAIKSFTSKTCTAVGVQVPSLTNSTSNLTAPTTGILAPSVTGVAFTGDAYPQYVSSCGVHYVLGMVGWVLWMRYVEG